MRCPLLMDHQRQYINKQAGTLGKVTVANSGRELLGTKLEAICLLSLSFIFLVVSFGPQ